MERKSLALPEIGIIAGTRAALGAGLGLLLADRLDKRTRSAVGWTLLAVGVLSTIPIAIQLFSDSSSTHALDNMEEESDVEAGMMEPSEFPAS